MVKGLGEVANGALHPVLTPVHAMILLGLGLLIALQIPQNMRTPIRWFTPASAVALGLTAFVSIGEIYPPVLIGLALVIGALVGLDKRLPRPAIGVICLLAALAIGADSGLETGTPLAIGKTLLGTFLAMNALVLYIALSASNGSNTPWARIAMRIVGSWIVAISLMVLAFALKKGA